MKLVLNDQVGRAQQAVLLVAHGRKRWRSGVTGRVNSCYFRRKEPMARADSINPAKEHLRFPAPRHLGKLIDGGEKDARRAPVNLLINHHHREPLSRRERGGEIAAAVIVAAVDDGAADVRRCFEGANVAPWLDFRAAPRATRKLRG